MSAEDEFAALRRLAERRAVLADRTEAATRELDAECWRLVDEVGVGVSGVARVLGCSPAQVSTRAQRHRDREGIPHPDPGRRERGRRAHPKAADR